METLALTPALYSVTALATAITSAMASATATASATALFMDPAAMVMDMAMVMAAQAHQPHSHTK